MDNEKKRPHENDGHKKNRPPRHKGYFITPAEKGERKDKNERNDKIEKNDRSTVSAKPHAQEGNSHSKPHAPQKERPAQADGNQKRPERKPAPHGAPKADEQKNEQRNEQKHPHHPHGRHRRGGQHHRGAEKKVQENPVVEQNLIENAEQEVARPETQPPKREFERPQHRNQQKRGKFRPSEQKSDGLLLGSLDEKAEESASQVKKEPEVVTDPASIPTDILETPVSVSGAVTPVVDDGTQKIEIVGVRFKSSGKVYYFDPQGKRYSRASHAIVETARGLEYGEVALCNTFVKEEDVVLPLRPVIRAATPEDEAHNKDNKRREDEAFKICNEKIAAHELDMKLIDAQYTFDNTKLLFYFTSAGRVDFRELVKDLASVFRTRIELRQIGIRDEAKLMGGLGPCGRPLCCALFLTDFGQVSIKMAKEQNLSLNSSKISGICGRLMCCLRYEHETYEYEIKRTPPVDSVVRTPDGNGIVTEMNPLVGTVKVRLSASPETPPKLYKRDDVTVLQRRASRSNDNDDNNNVNESEEE